jgi:hypothetical protein
MIWEEYFAARVGINASAGLIQMLGMIRVEDFTRPQVQTVYWI